MNLIRIAQTYNTTLPNPPIITHLIWMVDDGGDFLGVTLHDGDHLLRVLVEDHRILVVAAGNDAGGVTQADVEGQDAGHAGTMQALRGR